jgi:hypothetical protein
VRHPIDDDVFVFGQRRFEIGIAGEALFQLHPEIVLDIHAAALPEAVTSHGEN